MTPGDDDLVRAILDGDVEQFSELMRRYERLVFKVAWSYGGSREDALDITQTVFLKVYRSLHSFRTDSSFKTWLLRITYNEGVNWIRAVGGKRGLHDELEEAAERLVSPPDQESGLVGREQKVQLRRGLAQLSDRYRTAIVLRYLHGMPIREIAGVLECNENLTKNILFRGIRSLRRAVEA